MDVFEVPDLLKNILAGPILHEIRLIAALRMVCRRYRDMLAAVVGAETRTRCGATYTAVTYTVMDFFGCGPYLTAPAAEHHLDEIYFRGEDASIDIEFATVIQNKYTNGSCSKFGRGWALSAAEFVAINRLFGLESAPYGTLIAEDDAPTTGTIIARCDRDQDSMYVKFDDGSYHYLMRSDYVSDDYEIFYMYHGHVHSSRHDLGNFSNLHRFKKST